MSIEAFKSFVRERPNLIKYINSGEATWQKFYDMFELYGPDNSIWNNYLGITSNSPVTLKDVFNTVKNMDMNEVQKGINSLQKGIAYLEEIFASSKQELPKIREPKPLYKRLDD